MLYDAAGSLIFAVDTGFLNGTFCLLSGHAAPLTFVNAPGAGRPQREDPSLNLHLTLVIRCDQRESHSPGGLP